MSNVSGRSTDFDFWEFVGCGVCHLEFIKDSGALSSVPFWLTDCGHVVCNTHLNADQTCAVCGNPKMQLMPLQRELEPPLSNWFGSVSQGFDSVAYSFRFQLSTMATLVRYFKKKYHQYRPLHDRLREEHAETKRLRKLVDELRIENSNLRQQLHMGGSDNAQRLNVNGKRARTDDDGYYNGQRTSSPRSTATPIGPDRLTLPPGHHQPHFNSRQSLQVPSAKPEKQSIQYVYLTGKAYSLQHGLRSLADILRISLPAVRKRNPWRCLSYPIFSLVQPGALLNVPRTTPTWMVPLCNRFLSLLEE
ncbi:hypothetical protein GY45DRAFT_1291364 [Cubamyces sp. BRFM 1775]|nr:hypothetical protein GY45DRAFT_1291364 [Cubamyces sp. BRFM 1775]